MLRKKGPGLKKVSSLAWKVKMVQGRLSFLNPYKHELTFFSVSYNLLISVTNLWTSHAIATAILNA